MGFCHARVWRSLVAAFSAAALAAACGGAGGNAVPVAGPIGLVTIAEDTTAAFLLTGSDAEDPPAGLTVQVLAGPSNGSLDFSSGSAPLLLTYTPDPDFNGGDSFSFIVTDSGGQASDPVTVSVMVMAVNDVPAALGPGAQLTAEDTPGAPITLTGVDVEDAPAALTVAISGGPSNGSLDVSAGTAPLDVVYTPDPDFNGADSFSFVVSDSEGAPSAPVLVNVSVTALNDAPAGVDDAAVTAEDTPVTTNVLANDTDVDIATNGDSLSVTGASNGSNGTTALNPDGTITYTPGAHFSGADSFTYTLEDAAGAPSMATVDVTVAAVADAPTLSASPAAGVEDGAVGLTIASALVDGDGSETLSIEISGVPAGASLSAGTDNLGGSWTLAPADLAGLSFTPPLHSDADLTLALAATATETSNADAATTLATLDVTLTAVADAPTLAPVAAAGGEDTAIALSTGAALVDTDGSESLALTITGVPAGASFSAGTNGGGGSWTFTAAQLVGLTLTPPPDDDADFTLTLTATASETSNSDQALTVAALDVTVAAVADAPTLTVSGASGDEDTDIGLSISAALVDTDGSESLGDVRLTGVPTGSTFGGAGVNLGGGAWRFTAAELVGLIVRPPLDRDTDFTLGAQVTSTETTGGDQATATDSILVNVIPIPDPPTATVVSVFLAEDTFADFFLTGTDPDTGDSVQVSAVTTAPSWGTLTLPGGGPLGLPKPAALQVRYTPGPDFNGLDALAFTVTDGALTSAPATVLFTVTPLDDGPPVAAADAATTPKDTPVTINVLANDTVVDGPPVVTVTAPPAMGTTMVEADGQITYTPAANDTGLYSFTYQIDDIDGQTATAVVDVTVEPPGIPAGVWVVDIDNVSGTEDGTSWATALTRVQDAIDAASTGEQVWVAEGVYKAAAANLPVVTMKDGVDIYGGFAGTEIALADRPDPVLVTTLSGDFTDDGTTADDSYHVVVGASSARLDGVVVTKGNASDFSVFTNARGAGIFIENETDMVLANSRILGNVAIGEGAGLYFDNFVLPFAALTLDQVEFASNSAGSFGSAASIDRTDQLTIVGVWVHDNSATSFEAFRVERGVDVTIDATLIQNNVGIGLDIRQSSAVATDLRVLSNDGGLFLVSNPSFRLDRSLLAGNVAASLDGGGISAQGACASFELINSTFDFNTAPDGGGLALISLTCDAIILNCTFSRNIADTRFGGGVEYVPGGAGGTATFVNTSFVGNSSVNTGGVGASIGDNPVSLFLKNTVAWGNTAPIAPGVGTFGATALPPRSDVGCADVSLGTSFSHTTIVADPFVPLDRDGDGIDEYYLKHAGLDGEVIDTPCVDNGSNFLADNAITGYPAFGLDWRGLTTRTDVMTETDVDGAGTEQVDAGMHYAP